MAEEVSNFVETVVVSCSDILLSEGVLLDEALHGKHSNADDAQRPLFQAASVVLLSTPTRIPRAFSAS